MLFLFRFAKHVFLVDDLLLIRGQAVNIMNSLIGSKNIENDFDNLLCKYPSILKCIPILKRRKSFAGQKITIRAGW